MVLSIYYLGNGFHYPQQVIDMANRPHMNGMYVSSVKRRYQFIGYLKNTGVKVLFTSCLYEDTLKREFVLINERSKLGSPVQQDTSPKYTGDFDSLFTYAVNYSRPTTYNEPTLNIQAGPEKVDTSWDTAVANDNRWVFKRINGKISIFSDKPFSSSYSYMKIEGDTIKRYSYDSIKLALCKNMDCEKKLMYRDIGIKSSTALLLSGLGLAIVGFTQSSVTEKRDNHGNITRTEYDSPLFFVGVGLLAVSWIPYVLVKNNFVKAVYSFNL